MNPPNPKSYHIFLDDERYPKDVNWVDLPMVNWTIVRSYKDFINIIRDQGLPLTVTFDHDLADEHYEEHKVAHDEKMLSFGVIRYNTFSERTGYDCAKWLANYCLDNDLPIPQYYTHTRNDIGEENIISILESARKVMEGRKSHD